MGKHTIFFGPSGLLRSGWRVAVFLGLYIFTVSVLASVVWTAWATAGLAPAERLVAFLVSSIIGLVPALVLGWYCGKWFEGLPLAALGASFSPGWFRNLMLGLAFGAASLGIAILIASVFGSFRFELNTTAGTSEILAALAISLAIFAAGAAFEEALFRGYVFQTLTRAGLAWLAIILTAVFFGGLHMNNPGAGAISTVDTVIAGIVFCLAYLRSRDLWFPFGIHLMWNWLQGSFFGIEVSGLTEISSVSALKEIDNGPAWLTGGSYGIEGGIASTISLLITAAVIYFAPFIRPSRVAAEDGRDARASGS